MSGMDDGGRADEDERGGGVLRDEGLSKNPIRNLMSAGVPSLRSDDLTEIVARARDCFHSFISQTLRRRYKRPPIYLVDGWVTDALGYFTYEAPPRAGVLPNSCAPQRPGTGGRFAPVAGLFEGLQQFLSVVDGLSVLTVEPRKEILRARCHALLADPSGAREACLVVEDLRRSAFAVQDVLERDPVLSSEENPAFFVVFDERADKLIAAIERFAKAPRPSIAGVSFEGGRHGGLLLESIPELDIEGPAIVIAPANIGAWARSMPVGWAGRCTDASRLWLGARRQEQLGLAAAIGNVVQHEMTHAMLRLANDVPEDSDQAPSQTALYRSRSEIEEGLANFVAALATTMAVIKSERGIIGSKLLDLSGRQHGRAFEALEPLRRWTFADYHEGATQACLSALEGNARNFKAFGGLLAMFATDHASIDWDATYAALTRGVISTTKLPLGPRP